MPGGVNSPVRAFQPYPFFTERAKGSRLFDVDGKEYVDYCLGYGPLILGHAHPKIVDAVRAPLEKGSLFGTPTEQEVELVKEIKFSKVHVYQYEDRPSTEALKLPNKGSKKVMKAREKILAKEAKTVHVNYI